MGLSNLPSVSRFKKVISLLVAVSFIFSNIAFADIPKQSPQEAKKAAQITTDPDKIVIPHDYGIVKAKYVAKDSRRLIIHIQDAHCNYEAQSNIIKILECLIKNDGLGLISVEGADGFIDTSWFKAFPDADIRKEVADYFMKKGEITGPEFLSITSDYPIKLFGAETRSYYIDNLNAFTSSYPLKEESEKYFNQIKAVLNKLKKDIYSAQLMDLDTKIQDYESKKLSFTDYVKYLETLAVAHKVNLRQYENLFKLVSVLVYEKKINFNVVDKERAAIIDAITKKLDKEQLTELVNRSLEFKVSKISSVEYYDYLRNLALKYGISLANDYPNLFNYIIYNSVYSRIENEKLFSDIKKFEEAVKEKLFVNDDQRTLDKLSRNINTLLGLVNIRLLNEDFEYYKAHREEFAHEVFASFINKMVAKFGFAYELDQPSQAVRESMPKLEDFYAIAIKRDKALVDNTIQAMKKENAQVSVLVTGGFHSEGITRILEKQGVSYMVICPNITKDVETPYIKVLTNQRTPLEEILSDTAAKTADAKNVNNGMLAPYLITAARMTGIREIADRTAADLKAWAVMNMSPWLPTAIADLEKMKIQPTPAVLAARFNADVDRAVEKYIAERQPGSTEAAALRRGAKDVKKTAPEVIAELLARAKKPSGNDEIPPLGDAITMTGEALTPEHHRQVNEIIRNAFSTKVAQRVNILDGVEVYVIPGLEQCDSFLIAHAGRGGELMSHHKQRVYLSPTRYEWIKTLSPQAQAQFWAHETAHPRMKNENPSVTEKEVQNAYPINSVLLEARAQLNFDMFLSDLKSAGERLSRFNNYGTPISMLYNIKRLDERGVEDAGSMVGLYESANDIFRNRYKMAAGLLSFIPSVEDPAERRHDMPGFLGIMDNMQNHGVSDEQYMNDLILVITDGGEKTRFAYKILSEGYAGLLRLPGRRSYNIRELGVLMLVATMNYLPDGHRRFIGWAASDNFAALGNANIGGVPLNDRITMVSKLRDAAVVKGGVMLQLFDKKTADAINSLPESATMNDIKKVVEDINKGKGEYVRILKLIADEHLKELGLLAVSSDGKLIDFVEKEENIGKLIRLFAKFGGQLYKNPYLEMLDKDFAKALYVNLRDTPARTPGVGTLDRLAVGYMQGVYQSRFTTLDKWMEIAHKGIDDEDWKNVKLKVDKTLEVLKNETGKSEIYVIDYGEGNKWVDLANLHSYNNFLDMVIYDDNIRKILTLPKRSNIAADTVHISRKTKVEFSGYGRRLVENSVIKGNGKVIIEEGVLISGSLIEVSEGRTLVIKKGTKILNSHLKNIDLVYHGEGPYIIDAYFSELYEQDYLDVYANEWVGTLRLDGSVYAARNIISRGFKGEKIAYDELAWQALVKDHPAYLGQFNFPDVGHKDFISLTDRNLGGRDFKQAQKKVDYRWLETLKATLLDQIRSTYLANMPNEVRDKLIRARAYEIGENRRRSRQPGGDKADWKQAEAELVAEGVISPASTQNPGAIRMNGGGLAAFEHGTRVKGFPVEAVGNVQETLKMENSINSVISKLIKLGDIPYMVSNKGIHLAGDIDIPSYIFTENNKKGVELRAKLDQLGINFIVIKGLKEELKKLGLAEDLVFHYGVTRSSVYIDEADFNYLFSLSNGVDIIVEGAKHEKAHIDNELANLKNPKIKFLSEDEVEKIAPSQNVRFTLSLKEISEISNKLEKATTVDDLKTFILRIRNVNLWANYVAVSVGLEDRRDELFIARSDLARRISELLMAQQQKNKMLIDALVEQSISDMRRHIDILVSNGKMTKSQGDATLNRAIAFLKEWLDTKNNIPDYIKQGIYRGMIEGRFGDLLYAYGFGWRQFGTAGIRNQAVNSEFKGILNKELEEFAQNPHAAILTGPNLMNSVTLLQQVAALSNVMLGLKEKIERIISLQEKGKGIADAAKELNIDTEFAQNIIDNTVTIGYDSRLNGAYFGHLLAAAFLKNGIKVNLFDNPSGVPAGASVAKGPVFFGELVNQLEFAEFKNNIKGSAFGVLISASHSEAEYNGFKAFLGYQKSQVDAATKNMIMNARAEVNYNEMRIDLDTGSMEDLNKIFRNQRANLTWLGQAEKLSQEKRDYCGAKFVSFYPLYFAYLGKRSPIPYEKLTEQQRLAIQAVKKGLQALYTAFFGVGAEPAANLPSFYRAMGYEALEVVDRQTKVMDGRFPGHIMPDPGVVEGWMSNLYDYMRQISGENLENAGNAIQAINSKEVGAATDPDVDRAGMMLNLEPGEQGNVKESFIEWMNKNLKGVSESQKSQIISSLKKELKDKWLLTANDAWTFMAYYKLKLLDQYGLLDRNKTYILMKSHVTTDGLQKVAEYYRNKGYNVFVVNTYVGFTELAKKGRDLFAIASTAWNIKNLLGEGKEFVVQLETLKKQNEILKQNVPYETAGLPLIEEAIKALETRDLEKAASLLDVIAHMEIVVACEESNGYGELGRYVPEKGIVEGAHISEKDGGLALYEFLELLSYGKAIWNKSGYELMTEMMDNIGYCATDNQFLKYPGLTGIQEKTDTLEGLEKILAVALQKAIDRGEKVTLFNGKYTVRKVAIYRDKKYDVIYNGFPEEGIQLVIETKNGSIALTTFRPSGTGDTNRDYNWIIGPVPKPGSNLEAYRNGIGEELSELRRDFFGVFGRDTGYAMLEKGDFYGVLTALKEAGRDGQLGIFRKFVDNPIEFTPMEDILISTAMTYSFTTRKQDFTHMEAGKRNDELSKIALAKASNTRAWKDYLSSDETMDYPNKFQIYANGKPVLEIPSYVVKPLMASLAAFAVGELISKGLAEAEITSQDLEVTNEILTQLKPIISSIRAEKQAVVILAQKMHTPLVAPTPEIAAEFLKGGYNTPKNIQHGYGVPAGAAIDGSFAIGNEGNQGYYVNGGKEIFLSTTASMRDFFERRARILGTPIKYVIKPGIGGQHTPFQGIASTFQVIDAKAGTIIGEYELGKDYEASLVGVIEKLGIKWEEIAVIPSSKSGSTDETMMIFNEIFYVMLKHVSNLSYQNINGEQFAQLVFDTLHEVNFINGKERAAKDLFKVDRERFKTDSLIELIVMRAADKRIPLTGDMVKNIFGKVLGNMFFETTDRPASSRLSAFIRNSGLDKELGENAPGFGGMFDNVGGRWTADLHMMTFLAYHKLDAEVYWNVRYEGIKQVREGTHQANTLAKKILNENITDIALVVPNELFWFGKAMEQNFNESIWQKGFANLIAVKESAWEAQKANYAGRQASLVINISGTAIPADSFNVVNLNAFDLNVSKQKLANALGDLFTTFYGITHTVGNKLIAMALAEKGYTVNDVDINNLENPATRIFQQNLYLRQPYVELGKGLLEDKLKSLQEKGPQAISAELGRIREEAQLGRVISNVEELKLPGRASNMAELALVINEAVKYAQQTGRKFVPFIYLEGDKFLELREHLVNLGIEWVMQGTGDQHISYQQVLAQPQKYLPFIISFVPESMLPGRPAIGFAKGYLHNVSPNMVRDMFAEASYRALTEPRNNEAGEKVTGAAGIFMRIIDKEDNRDMLVQSFEKVMAPETKETAFDHSIESIMQSSATGERARQVAETLLKVNATPVAKKHLIFVKSAIPAQQLATTTAINYANFCTDYYNEMEGYTADIVANYEEAVKLLSKNPDWDKTNTIVGLIDRQSLDKMTAELQKNKMEGKTKLLPMEAFDKEQFVPIKGFFDLMSVLVQINRPLDKPEDRELRDAIRDLLNEIGVRDVDGLVGALSIAAYFEDPVKFAKNFIIRLLPPTRASNPAELKERYNAAKKVVESL